MPDLWHLTILTGHMRLSPRSEVADHVVSGLQVIIAGGGGAVGNTGWAMLFVERTPNGAIFDLSLRGVEVARCFLAITPASEQRLWGEASAYPALPGVRLTKPGALPWLAVGLLPDGMVLLGNQPDLMLELGRFRAVRRLGTVGNSIADEPRSLTRPTRRKNLFEAPRTFRTLFSALPGAYLPYSCLPRQQPGGIALW
jgi:hypothetical protein